MKGYVYVLTNEAMPGLVKIGRSKHAAGVRAKQIYKGDTGVPLPFDVHFECLFDDCIEGEALVHEELQDERVNPNREFFRLDPEKAMLRVMDIRANYHCHAVSYADLVLSDAQILGFAREMGRSPMDVTQAIHHLGAEDLSPGMERWDAKLEATRERHEAEAVKLEVVE